MDDLRFAVPLYSVGSAAAYLRVPPSTLQTWVDGYVRPGRAGNDVHGDPVVTAFSAARGMPRLPFIGLAEAYALNAFRRAGVPLQRVRSSLEALSREVGEHALASQRLFTDGAEVMWEVASRSPEDGDVVRRLVVPRSGQIVFRDAVEQYLRQVTFDEAGYAALIHLPHYGGAEVVLDPLRNSGRPMFARGGVAVESALSRLHAGDTMQDTADDLGVPLEDLRAASLAA